MVVFLTPFGRNPLKAGSLAAVLLRIAGAGSIALGAGMAVAQEAPSQSWQLRHVRVEIDPSATLPVFDNLEPAARRDTVILAVRSAVEKAARGVFIGRRPADLVIRVQEILPGGSAGSDFSGLVEAEFRDAATGAPLVQPGALRFSRSTSDGLGRTFGGFFSGPDERDFAGEVVVATRDWMSSLECADAACTEAVALGFSPLPERIAIAEPVPVAEPAVEAEPVPVAEATPEPEPEIAPEPEAETPDPVVAEAAPERVAEPEAGGGGFFSSLFGSSDETEEAAPEAEETELAEAEPDEDVQAQEPPTQDTVVAEETSPPAETPDVAPEPAEPAETLAEASDEAETAPEADEPGFFSRLFSDNPEEPAEAEEIVIAEAPAAEPAPAQPEESEIDALVKEAEAEAALEAAPVPETPPATALSIPEPEATEPEDDGPGFFARLFDSSDEPEAEPAPEPVTSKPVVAEATAPAEIVPDSADASSTEDEEFQTALLSPPAAEPAPAPTPPIASPTPAARSTPEAEESESDEGGFFSRIGSVFDSDDGEAPVPARKPDTGNADTVELAAVAEEPAPEPVLEADPNRVPEAPGAPSATAGDGASFAALSDGLRSDRLPEVTTPDPEPPRNPAGVEARGTVPVVDPEPVIEPEPEPAATVPDTDNAGAGGDATENADTASPAPTPPVRVLRNPAQLPREAAPLDLGRAPATGSAPEVVLPAPTPAPSPAATPDPAPAPVEREPVREVETQIAAIDPSSQGPTLANSQWIGFTPAVFGDNRNRPGRWIAGPFDRKERVGWITDTATGSTTRVTLVWRDAPPGSQALLSSEAARALGLSPGGVANVAVYVPR